jgi:hypothetical protein
MLYSERLRVPLLESLDQQQQEGKEQGPIVVEVCGGSGVTIELLQQWKEAYPLPVQEAAK